ncbi:MAG TPA: hypothetical protein VJM82_07330, partial [Nitrospiraceae bacterium]|nr:hypothetical protein [Nitrospiraceae bacterium]
MNAECGTLRLLTALVCLCLFPLMTSETRAQQAFAPLQNLRVIDTPSDSGGGLTVLWSKADYDAPDVRYQILMGEGAEKKVVAEFPANSHYVRDVKGPWWARVDRPDVHQFNLKSGKGIELKNGTPYAVTVAVVKGT